MEIIEKYDNHLTENPMYAFIKSLKNSNIELEFK